MGGPLFGYAVEMNPHGSYTRFIDSLSAVNLSFDVTAEQMACSSRTLLVLLAHLFLNLPSLLPKVVYSLHLSLFVLFYIYLFDYCYNYNLVFLNSFDSKF